MNLSLSIHNIYNVLLTDIPEDKRFFLEREYEYFKVEKLDRVDLEIKFINKIDIPEQSVSLLENFFYQDGYFYFNFGGSLLCVPIKDFDKKKMLVEAEKAISPWMIFYAIEKILHTKVLEKDFCFFHAAGVAENGMATIYASSGGVGKTKWLLNKIKNGSAFLGDDLVLISRSKDAFVYARGLNIHIYHGVYYRKLLGQLSFFISIRKIAVIATLIILRFFFGFFPIVKKRLDESIKYRSTFRVHIKRIFPEVKIIDRCKVSKIIIALTVNSNTSCGENLGLRQTVNFILNSTNYERLAHINRYLEVFWAHGDEISFKVRKYLDRLVRKEMNTVYRIIKQCEIEHIRVPK